MAMVLVDVVVPTCGMSKHLQDRPHSSAWQTKKKSLICTFLVNNNTKTSH